MKKDHSKCRVCRYKDSRFIFTATILGRSVDYFECPRCQYVQTELPHWLDEAYRVPINAVDTGILQRNLANTGIVLAAMFAKGCRSGRLVDCAGGYGILVRMLRDYGLDAWWDDPYCENLLAGGFENRGVPADMVTAFEAFEHFVNPIMDIERLFRLAPSILLSTAVIPSPTPDPATWWYYGLEHGQHIGFYRVQTLRYLAGRFGKHLVTDGATYHLITDKPLSPLLWRVGLAIAARWPRLFSIGLTSKTWADFLDIRSRSRSR